jgi:ABC-type transport system involved in multi-copper enzyme maturation permease subunit
MGATRKMIRTIVKRDLLDNILSFKFIACILVALVLTVISTIVHAANYLDRLEDYNKGVALAQDQLTKVPVFSFLEVTIYKKPSVISILIPGIEARTGNSLTMTHREIPTSLKGGFVKNEFASVLSFFDLYSIIVTIFTILAILLSYGSISGEKEGGMLSLVLSNSVPRWRYLVGKYLGGMISLALAILLCFLAGLIIPVLSRRSVLDTSFFVTVSLLYVFCLLYLSAVLLAGILASCLTKNSFQSLIIILAVYLLAVFLLPLGVDSAAEGLMARKVRSLERNTRELFKQRALEINKVAKTIPVHRSWSSQESFGPKILLARLNPPQTIAYYESLCSQTERLNEEYALKTHALRVQDLHIRQGIGRVRNLVLELSPPSCLERIMELETGTGQEDLDRFFTQVTQYWRQYVHYLDEENAFGLRYFYPYSGDLPPDEKTLVDELTQAVSERGRTSWDVSAYQKIRAVISTLNERYKRDITPLDLGDMPTFTYQMRTFGERFRDWSMGLLILIFDNLLVFALAFFAFVRYDPRIEA